MIHPDGSPLEPPEHFRSSSRFAFVFVVSSLLLFIFAPAARAISLFDVVQLTKAGYSDREITDLIQKTDSRFYVDAETITTLKKEGVREPVIRAIMQARTDEKPPQEGSPGSDRPASSPRDSAEVAPHSDERDAPHHSDSWRDTPAPQPPGRQPEAGGAAVRHEGTPRAQTTAARAVFAALPFEEPATGHSHAAGHVHQAIGLGGVPLLLVRSEAGYRSVSERANAIAEVLNRALASGAGSFVARTSSPAAVWFQPAAGGEQVKVLPVSAGDIFAWQRRSLGTVSAGRLAEYWAALLDDFTRVLVYKQPPSAIATLHLADSLQSIYRETTSQSRDDDSIPRILDHLTTEEKDHLLELASRVPAEFEATRRRP